MKPSITGLCAECDRRIKIRPCGGDWLNEVQPFKHTNPKTGKPCDGRFMDVDVKTWIEKK